MARRFFLTTAVLFLLIPTFLLAQDNATVVFYGAIQSANATALVINGQIVDIRGAQMETPVVVGVTVRVTASYAEDGSLVARQVDPVSPGLVPGLVEIVGVIDQIDSSMLLLNGIRVSIIGAQLDLPLNIGAVVRLYAEQTAPNEWTARLVTGIRLGGPRLPAATPEVSPPNATPEVRAPTATPEVAAPNATPELSMPATTPEVGADTPPQSETVVIEGTLTAIGSKAILVDGKRYDMSAAQRDGTLIVGAHVRLELQVLNGQAVLKEIKVVETGSAASSESGSNNSGSSSSGSNDSSSGKGGSDG